MLINGFQPLTNVRKNSYLDVEECHNILRSSRQDVFYKNGVLENFTTFNRKTSMQDSFLPKLQTFRPLPKKRATQDLI